MKENPRTYYSTDKGVHVKGISCNMYLHASHLSRRPDRNIWSRCIPLAPPTDNLAAGVSLSFGCQGSSCALGLLIRA